MSRRRSLAFSGKPKEMGSVLLGAFGENQSPRQARGQEGFPMTQRYCADSDLCSVYEASSALKNETLNE